mmetsp:Transcript_17184/g.21080  ORF Transcript_17184/g.21080 Transcript_17184/m.21080 type:complete len:95 (-) Transcript_17184:48-332(-)
MTGTKSPSTKSSFLTMGREQLLPGNQIPIYSETVQGRVGEPNPRCGIASHDRERRCDGDVVGNQIPRRDTHPMMARRRGEQNPHRGTVTSHDGK